MEFFSNENHISTNVSKEIDKTNINESKDNHNEIINHNSPNSSPMQYKNIIIENCDFENNSIKNQEKELINGTLENPNDQDLNNFKHGNSEKNFDQLSIQNVPYPNCIPLSKNINNPLLKEKDESAFEQNLISKNNCNTYENNKNFESLLNDNDFSDNNQSLQNTNNFLSTPIKNSITELNSEEKNKRSSIGDIRANYNIDCNNMINQRNFFRNSNFPEEIKFIENGDQPIFENYNTYAFNNSIRGEDKGGVLFQSVKVRKSYEEKVKVMEIRLKRLKEQDEDLNKKLTIEKTKVKKVEKIRENVNENRKKYQLEKEQRQKEIENMKKQVLIEKEKRRENLLKSKENIKKEKEKKFSIIKKDSMMLNCLLTSVKTQMENVKSYKYFKTKQHEMSSKIERFQKVKDKAEQVKEKFENKINIEKNKTFDLKKKLEKLEELENEYIHKLENTIIRNKNEFDQIEKKKGLNVSVNSLKIKQEILNRNDSKKLFETSLLKRLSFEKLCEMSVKENSKNNENDLQSEIEDKINTSRLRALTTKTNDEEVKEKNLIKKNINNNNVNTNDIDQNKINNKAQASKKFTNPCKIISIDEKPIQNKNLIKKTFIQNTNSKLNTNNNNCPNKNINSHNFKIPNDTNRNFYSNKMKNFSTNETLTESENKKEKTFSKKKFNKIENEKTSFSDVKKKEKALSKKVLNKTENENIGSSDITNVSSKNTSENQHIFKKVKPTLIKNNSCAVIDKVWKKNNMNLNSSNQKQNESKAKINSNINPFMMKTNKELKIPPIKTSLKNINKIKINNKEKNEPIKKK